MVGTVVGKYRILDRIGRGSMGTVYRAEDKTVVTLGVWDNHTIERLNIQSPGDIEKKFGKPQRVEDIPELLIHYYDGGKTSVLWNKQEAQLNAVNVSR